MSVVAWKQGVPLLAADSGGIVNGSWMESIKIRKLEDGRIVGCVGVCADGVLFAEWLHSGADRNNPPKWAVGGKDQEGNFGALVLSPDGKCEHWCVKLVAEPILEDFFAIGSGGDVARGAMAAGADPIDAVEIACKIDTGCRGPVRYREI